MDLGVIVFRVNAMSHTVYYTHLSLAFNEFQECLGAPLLTVFVTTRVLLLFTLFGYYLG